MQGLNDFYPLLEAIVSFMDEGVIIADEKGEVLYQNPAAGEMLGLASNTPIQSLESIGIGDLGTISEAGKTTGYKLDDGFVRLERRVNGEGPPRHLEFHTGVIQTPRSKKRLRLVITHDRTDTRNLEAVLNRRSDELVTNDPRMLDILTKIDQVSASNASVLLQGESGTGKTHLGRIIHRKSLRANGPFVEVNCAAIPEPLIESELFGHVKGAFTGATQDRQGRFQAADKGTLFLDEVGEIPLHLQAKLLRAVQDQEFEMVGSDKPIRVDVRIISASNKNLKDMVDANEFRSDLFYRLAVIPMLIPALRNRPGDIPLMLKKFCSNLMERGYSDEIECSPGAMRLMMDYPWPGNVREMENAVEHAMVCAVNNVVLPESLPQDIREYTGTVIAEPFPANLPNQRQSREIEGALKEAGGNRSQAARLLGIDRTTLWRRMQRLGVAG